MPNRDIIVIGGSSGATTPLNEILARLDADLRAAVFIVIHIPSHGIGVPSTIISPVGKLPIRQAESGLKIEHGHVYLAAPDRHLLLSGSHMILGHGPRENMVRPGIDPLFRSAAIHYGPRVIGVVLSGLLSDGAAGLDAIKRCGGMALVQEPSDAIAGDMPRCALEATSVDLCLPARRLGDALCGLVREQAGRPLPIPPEIELEVEIAAGERVGRDDNGQIADPSPLACPSCGGALSILKVDRSPRRRCEAGHAHTIDTLARKQERRVGEALGVSLRIIEERAEFVHRMAENARRGRRPAVAKMYDARAAEYRQNADIIRRVMLEFLKAKPSQSER